MCIVRAFQGSAKLRRERHVAGTPIFRGEPRIFRHAAPNGAWPVKEGGCYYTHGAPNRALKTALSEN